MVGEHTCTVRSGATPGEGAILHCTVTVATPGEVAILHCTITVFHADDTWQDDIVRRF
jgi:hypothetical protein